MLVRVYHSVYHHILVKRLMSKEEHGADWLRSRRSYRNRKAQGKFCQGKSDGGLHSPRCRLVAEEGGEGVAGSDHATWGQERASAELISWKGNWLSGSSLQTNITPDSHKWYNKSLDSLIINCSPSPSFNISIIGSPRN